MSDSVDSKTIKHTKTEPKINLQVVLAAIAVLSVGTALLAIFVLAEWAETSVLSHGVQHVLIFLAGLGFGTSMLGIYQTKGKRKMKVDLQADNKQITAKARATMTGPDVSGVAEFTEYDVDGWKYVHIRLTLQGDPKTLPAGKHAVHIHEKGDCECDGFKCAGGHFDPGPSGNTDPDANHGFHAGDLPSITVDEQGKGELETITTRVTLSDGPVSILQPEEGTSLMVHGNVDPYTPGESGSGHSGGPRLACGKIEKA